MGGSHTQSKKGFAYLVALLLVATPVLGYPPVIDVDPEVAKRCSAKGDVTAFVYQNRDSYTLEQMLEVFEESWNDSWSDLGRPTYVDSQRIIRDAYRKDYQDKYVRECCT